MGFDLGLRIMHVAWRSKGLKELFAVVQGHRVGMHLVNLFDLGLSVRKPE